MEGAKRVVLMGVMLGAWIITAPEAAEGAGQTERTPRDPVKFSRPQFVEPPQVLFGDAGDGRCPDPSQVCFKDNKDILNGRRHLLRTDDIWIAYQYGEAATSLGFGLLTDNSKITTSASESLAGSDSWSNPIVIGARLFDTPNDVAVSAVFDNNSLQWFLNDSRDTVARGSIPAVVLGFQPSFAAAADFTGDGYDDLIFFEGHYFAEGRGPVVIAATAVDLTSPSQGLKFGSWADFSGDRGNPLAITTGTVDGTLRVFSLARTKDDPIPMPNCHFLNDLVIVSYMVDPHSLAVTREATFPLTLPEEDAAGCGQFAAMAAGRFGNSLYDQLAVAYGVQGGTVKVIPIDFDAQGNPVQKPLYDTEETMGEGRAWIRSGRFDWSTPFDQAALLISWEENSLRILTFDQNLNVQSGPVNTTAIGQTLCVGDVAVGNFDRMMTVKNPTPPPDTLTTRNPNLQVAAFLQECETGNFIVQIFDVNPADSPTGTFQIGDSTVYSFQVPESEGILPENMAMAAVDLQGRSLRLGQPKIVTISKHQEATLVLAAPPMHVDAVVPDDPNNPNPPFGITNISGVPDGLFGGFTFTTSTDDNTRTTTTVSSSFSGEETLKGHFTAGNCDEGPCADISAHFAAKQQIESSTDSITGSFTQSAQTFSANTGFSDIVSYQDLAFTIYVYPVIGQTVCPSGNSSCDDSEKVPLLINMSGPDTVSTKEATPGDLLTWYQPPWIPGNILSYPGNIDQLQAAAFQNTDDFQELSDPVSWTIGSGGPTNASIDWTGGGSTGSNTTTKRNFSYEAGLSLTYQVGIQDVATAGATLDLNFGGSTGWSQLTESLKTLSASQGISFTRTAPLANADYTYTITPHIFGQKQPTDLVDDNTIPAQIQIYGALRTGYEVDVSPGSGGGFWHAWYSKAPDVALNQPNHWMVSLQTSDPKDGTCLAFNSTSSDVDCVTLGERLPTGLGEPIWLSSFHRMRGLFITDGPNGQGPQLTTATTGDELTLQARVYNLSMKSLPPGAQVHVRFMGMPWDTSQNIPAAPSFLIGEQVIAGDQLNPFDSGNTSPNWMLVPQPFDTGGTNCGGQSCDNQDLVFWVVVWIENADGTLGSELHQHGLTSIPADGDDFLDVAAREEPYSNNLGFYNQVFHIFPQTQPLQAPTPLEGEIGAQITKVGAAHRKLRPGQSTALAARVQTGGRDLQGGLEVAFYDGDPIRDGQLIGLQHLPHLSADSTYDFRVLFTPQRCGKHSIYVVAGGGTRHEQTAKLKKPIRVKGKGCRSNRQPG